MPQRNSSPYAPIPGTERPRRGLFVGRWGTLLERPSRGYCTRFADVRFTPGAIKALFRIQQAHWNIYLIGNVEAVAKGHVAAATWTRFEAALLEHLDGEGIRVLRNYACLEDPEGKAEHRRPSVFQFPNTGVLYHAAQVDGIALGESWLIGDSSLEIAAGDRAGCHTTGVRTGWAVEDGQIHIEATSAAANLAEAIAEVRAADAYVRP